jgi:hypothetical protein
MKKWSLMTSDAGDPLADAVSRLNSRWSFPPGRRKMESLVSSEAALRAASRWSIRFLIAAYAALHPGGARAAGNLCGTVHDAATGAVVGGAGIFVLTTGGTTTGFQGVSDAGGSFCISGIPAGTYDLEVQRDHYVTAFVRGVQVVDDVSGVDIGVLPSAATLFAPRPSPARTQVEFRFRLAAPGAVRLEVFDARGRRVRGWSSDDAATGESSVAWDLRDADGRAVPAGVYVVRLETTEGAVTRRFMRVR